MLTKYGKGHHHLDAFTEPSAVSRSVDTVALSLRQQSTAAKITGYICVGITLVIGTAIIAAFLFFSQVSANQKAEKERMFLSLKYQQQNDLLSKLTDSVTPTQLQNTINSLIDKANSTPLSQTIASPLDNIMYEITSSIIRIGAVLIGIFLIQILVTFARYNFKLASHLSMTATLISLTGSNLSDLKSTAPLFMPSGIGFGKEPTSPTEKVFEGAISAIRELSGKIPIK